MDFKYNGELKEIFETFKQLKELLKDNTSLHLLNAQYHEKMGLKQGVRPCRELSDINNTAIDCINSSVELLRIIETRLQINKK